jgi:hypothetical protein
MATGVWCNPLFRLFQFSEIASPSSRHHSYVSSPFIIDDYNQSQSAFYNPDDHNAVFKALLRDFPLSLTMYSKHRVPAPGLSLRPSTATLPSIVSHDYT